MQNFQPQSKDCNKLNNLLSIQHHGLYLQNAQSNSFSYLLNLCFYWQHLAKLLLAYFPLRLCNLNNKNFQFNAKAKQYFFIKSSLYYQHCIYSKLRQPWHQNWPTAIFRLKIKQCIILDSNILLVKYLGYLRERMTIKSYKIKILIGFIFNRIMILEESRNSAGIRSQVTEREKKREQI
ncbi:hypothetical protein BpHYR1_008824 [Brachionus plicatilis]|uniref:Uncharacterized protein n=1 Tax=Brachionus plicatilis TaxID=10195 RepID=A0A3M7R771_BRAPC|nr:hypothetical protein BpHYR1_008824 [Brachionus plicatilis]